MPNITHFSPGHAQLMYLFSGMPRCTYFFGHAHAFHYFLTWACPSYFHYKPLLNHLTYLAQVLGSNPSLVIRIFQSGFLFFQNYNEFKKKHKHTLLFITTKLDLCNSSYRNNEFTTL